ncbi:MAG: hypothetical protein E6Q06_03075 [Candidatus Moraniibacteriota bacterium]|nr:MAG: hypothetical protein E6Q06_03075 [Candidatus Moranbacteria bacterium]
MNQKEKEKKERESFEKWKKEKNAIVDHFFSSKRVTKSVIKSISTHDEKDVNFPLTNKERVLQEFGHRVAQLESARTQLERFPIIMSSYQRGLEKRKDGMSRIQQFIYHIGNYLSSVYIFEKRAEKLVSFLRRESRKLDCSAALEMELKDALKDFQKLWSH